MQHIVHYIRVPSLNPRVQTEIDPNSSGSFKLLLIEMVGNRSATKVQNPRDISGEMFQFYTPVKTLELF